MVSLKFTRQNFIDHIFQPYNNSVKFGNYSKIKYSDWRKLRDWAYDAAYTDEIICIRHYDNDGYYIGVQNCGELDLRFQEDDNALGYWLKRNYVEFFVYDESIKSAFNSNSSISTDWQNRSVTVRIENDDGFEYYPIDTTHNINKEKESMKFNFDFGPVDSSVRMSLYGMAIKNVSGTYVAYDSNSKQIMDVDIVNFDGADKFIYKMPAALKDIAVGDVIIHGRKPVFVQELHKDNRLKVLDVYDGEEKVIVPAVSPFGFNFVTKVVNFLGSLNTGADASNPFGNLGLMLALSNEGSNDMLPLMMLSSGGKMDMSNPLLMYALMGKNGNMSDMLPWMLMCGSSIQPTGCNGTCAGNCHCAE